MFKKAIVWTDIHFGKKNNSDTHNIDCLEFVQWVVDQGKKNKCEITICCGDFFDVRNSLNIKTMDYALKALTLLSNSFEKVYMVLGNHDLYYRDDRNVYSLRFAQHIKNIEIIDEITTIKDCTFVPWLIGDDWKKLTNVKSKYVFSHLELPNFFTNSKATMHDHGGINAEIFNGPEYIFTGHFHKRQVYKNKNGSQVIYIGNCFPHNYSDANDSDRGCMILEHGVEPEFINWADCPTYKTTTLSALLEEAEKYLEPKTSISADIDLDLEYDEVSFIKDTLQKQFNAREVILLPKKSDELLEEYSDKNAQFKSVESIVLGHINSLETEAFDKNLLAEIYTGL